MSTKNLILLASTDGDLGVLLEHAARRADCDLRCVSNAKDLISRSLARPPELILVDGELPDLSSEETRKNLQSFDSTRNVPFVLIVGSASELDARGGVGQGIGGILRKPFSLKSLLGMIDRARRGRGGK